MIGRLMSKERYDQVVTQVKQFRGAILVTDSCPICESGEGKIIVYKEGVKPCPLCTIYRK